MDERSKAREDIRAGARVEFGLAPLELREADREERVDVLHADRAAVGPLKVEDGGRERVRLEVQRRGGHGAGRHESPPAENRRDEVLRAYSKQSARMRERGEAAKYIPTASKHVPKEAHRNHDEGEDGRANEPDHAASATEFEHRVDCTGKAEAPANRS